MGTPLALLCPPPEDIDFQGEPSATKRSKFACRDDIVQQKESIAAKRERDELLLAQQRERDELLLAERRERLEFEKAEAKANAERFAANQQTMLSLSHALLDRQ
ncbi:unnamed protein product [Aphanomyces euteiches]